VAELKRPLGLRNVAAILTGSSAQAVIKAGGDRLDVYGTIAAKQVDVQKAIQRVVKKGLLCFGGSRQYPVLELTEVGRGEIEETTQEAPPPDATYEESEVTHSPDTIPPPEPEAIEGGTAADMLDTQLAEAVRCDREHAKARVESLRVFHPAEVARRAATRYTAAADMRQRSRLAWLVGELCAGEGLPLLVTWGNSEEADVRRIAASAIGKIYQQLGSEQSGVESYKTDAVRALVKLSQDEAPQVREHAEKALGMVP
jgi:hypothetical protein